MSTFFYDSYPVVDDEMVQPADSQSVTVGCCLPFIPPAFNRGPPVEHSDLSCPGLFYYFKKYENIVGGALLLLPAPALSLLLPFSR